MILLFGLLFLLYCAIDLLKVINIELEKKEDAALFCERLYRFCDNERYKTLS